MQASRPVRGAWIETRVARRNDGPIRGRAPYGARGLKLFRYPEVLLGSSGRAPYGARGLKPRLWSYLAITGEVAPRTGRVD